MGKRTSCKENSLAIVQNSHVTVDIYGGAGISEGLVAGRDQFCFIIFSKSADLVKDLGRL
jgi:hypothetical protein